MRKQISRQNHWFFGIAVLGMGLLFLIPAHAATENDLRQQIETKNQEIQKLEEEIKGYQKGIETTSLTAQTLQETIKKINQEVKNLNYELSLTQKKVGKKELEIRELVLKLLDTELSLREQQTQLAEVLRNLDEVERQTMIEILLNYQSFVDFFDVLEKNKTLENQIKISYENLSDIQKELTRQKTLAESTKNELLSLKDRLSDQRSLEEEQRKNKAQLLAQTKNQEAQYQKLLKTREEARKSILREIQSIEDELRRLIDPASIPQKGAGILQWPVQNPFITQQFGHTEFSQNTDVYKGNGHNGVDFRVRVGSSVLAAESGVIKDVGDTDTTCRGGSYGKWIVVEHSNNLSTLYGHLSRIKVIPGQIVERGAIIGLSGNTGYSTGPHLHFTVYASNTFRTAKTNHCGLVPAGGYINPIDYL